MAWTTQAGNVLIYKEVVLDDNSKDLVIGVDTKVPIEILSVYIELTTTAALGTRVPTIQVLDSGGDVVAQFPTGNGVVQSLSQNFLWIPGAASALDSTAAINTTDYVGTATQVSPMSALILSSGMTLRFLEVNDIDSATPGDDMLVFVMARQAR